MRPSFQGEGRWGERSLFTETAYAFVVIDWRGRSASRTAARARPAGPAAPTDGYDTVEWIATQPWSNGKIGTWGPSALGAAQFRTASREPPHLVCAVPVVMPLNLTYDIYFPGGALWEEFTRTLRRLGWDLYGQLAAHPMRGLVLAAARGDATISRRRRRRADAPHRRLVRHLRRPRDRDLRAPARRGRPAHARPHPACHRPVAAPHRQRRSAASCVSLEPWAGASIAPRAFFDRWLRGVETPEELDRPAITCFEMKPTADRRGGVSADRRRPGRRPARTSAGSILDPAADALASLPPAAATSDRYRYDPRIRCRRPAATCSRPRFRPVRATSGRSSRAPTSSSRAPRRSRARSPSPVVPESSCG